MLKLIIVNLSFVLSIQGYTSLPFMNTLFQQMDALLSPSSRSYYACIGESTRAYRSPSSDLLDINNCLNGYGIELDLW